MLTKSLHTVTAVTKVALHLRASSPGHYTSDRAAWDLVDDALGILGYKGEGATDPTITACVKAVTKAMQS